MIQAKYEVKSSIFSTMSSLAAQENALNLSQGFPDFKVDEKLIDCVNQAMKEGWNQYVPMPGLPELRNSIANLIENHYNVSLNGNDNITITAGATQAIFNIVTAVVKPGKKVLLFDPAYDCYAPSVLANGGIPIHIPIELENFEVNWELIKENIDVNTVLLIFNNPHNPTGRIFSESFLSQLEEIIIQNPNLYLLSDEVYEHIHFSKFESVIQRKRLFEKSFVVSSFGKTFHATGWKMGYITAPKNLIEYVRAIHQYIVFSVNSAMQKGLIDYLQEINFKVDIKTMYKEKKNLFVKGIEGSRFKIEPCDGTYFQILNFSEIDSKISDVEMAIKMTKVHKLAAIPLSVFNENNEDKKLLRFCFAKNDETLTKATEILCKI